MLKIGITRDYKRIRYENRNNTSSYDAMNESILYDTDTVTTIKIAFFCIGIGVADSISDPLILQLTSRFRSRRFIRITTKRSNKKQRSSNNRLLCTLRKWLSEQPRVERTKPKQWWHLRIWPEAKNPRGRDQYHCHACVICLVQQRIFETEWVKIHFESNYSPPFLSHRCKWTGFTSTE